MKLINRQDQETYSERLAHTVLVVVYLAIFAALCWLFKNVLTYVYTAWTDYGTMHDALEERKINIVKANLQRFPNSTVSFTDEQMVEIEKFLDKLDEDEDVQAVYTNME